MWLLKALFCEKYIFKVLCLTDLFMNLESLLIFFRVFSCLLKVFWFYENLHMKVFYLDDNAQEGQGFIYASSRIL